MASNTSVSLSDHHIAFARRQVESGRFATVSEVVRNALTREEEREARIAALDAAIQAGIDSGPARPFDWDAFMVRKFGSSGAV